MPVSYIRYKGYKFFFYSNEGDLLEPAQIMSEMRVAEAEEIVDVESPSKVKLAAVMMDVNSRVLKWSIAGAVEVHKRLFLEAMERGISAKNVKFEEAHDVG